MGYTPKLETKLNNFQASSLILGSSFIFKAHLVKVFMPV